MLGSFLDQSVWGPIRSVLLVIIGWLVGNAVFSETALRIFLIFCIKLGDCKSRKVTKPDFWKKFLIWRYSWKHLQISPISDTFIFGWLVGNAVFSETALTIFMIFCIKLGGYKGRKVTELDFFKKLLILRYLQNVSKLAQNQALSYFFSKTALTIFLGFWPEVSTKYDLQFEWKLFCRKFAIWRYLTSKSLNFGLASKLHNSKTVDLFFFFFLVFISKVSIQLPLSYECNPFYSKIAISKFLTLKMVPKPFRNYLKIKIFGQFSKNNSKGFSDFCWSSQCILVCHSCFMGTAGSFYVMSHVSNRFLLKFWPFNVVC